MRNVVIIVSGPAGLTAAVYAARANLSPLLIEGWQSGAHLTTTTEVENYPGFAKGIMGPELMKEMRAQAERFGTEFLTGDVSAVDLKTRPSTITIDGEHTVQTKTLIIATGASAIQIGVKNEARLKNLVTGKTTELPCAGVFVAIGHRPNTNLFSGQLDMDAKGYIHTTQGTATNVPGVFAAGDVQDSTYRQAVTAAGSGCMAAI